MENKEIPALCKLGNGAFVVTPSIYYQCPDCKKEMNCEYNSEDSQYYLICLGCNKVFSLVLKEVDKKLNK